MSKTVIPRRDRSLVMAKKPEDTTALSSYEELQHRNIQKRKELFRHDLESFRQMGFDKLKDELSAKTRTPRKPKKKRPVPPSRQSSRESTDKKLRRNAKTCPTCYQNGQQYKDEKYKVSYKFVSLNYTCKFCGAGPKQEFPSLPLTSVPNDLERYVRDLIKFSRKQG